MIATFCGRLRGGRAEQRVERLEELVGSGDQRDAATREALRLARSARGVEPDRVADPRLQRRRHLLVQDDPAGGRRALQHPEGVDVAGVAGRHGEHRSRAGVVMPAAPRGSRRAKGAVAAAAA